MPDTLSPALIAARLPPRRAAQRPPPSAPAALLRAGMHGALAARPAGPAWVFAYGSLMWEHSFPYVVAQPGTLRGFARRYCLRDVSNRGTPEAPGLTLGVEPSPEATCGGVLFQLPEDGLEDALWAVWKHEMPCGFYHAAWVTVSAGDGEPPRRALTFVADPTHPLHAGALPEDAVAEVLARSVGPQGPAAEYLRETAAELRRQGLPDAALDRLEAAVAALLASAGAPARSPA